ncbi:FixH family protein [Pannonibacter sp. Pt2]|uniref:FixH family protein n=1 Tax=Pannonibacter anstelovis TaxID=3121537 RepID=A0ABU7ZJU2_9HYPH
MTQTLARTGKGDGTAGAARRPMTGWTVLIWLCCFFGAVFAANGVFLWVAIGSFPGTVVDSSYKAGQAFNGEVAAAREQASRGWQVGVHLERSIEGRAQIAITAEKADGSPVSGVSFEAKLMHPVATGLDQTVDLIEGESGHYAALTPEPVAAGNWHLIIEAHGAEGRVFRSENKLFLKD